MDWLNIHRSTLAAEQFLGCEPIQRATWLCLMAYCADQENGGRIEGAAEWNDRKWQHVVRVTKSEVSESCPLWSWDGGAVVVWAYPTEKEAEVRRNRENGGKGGRPPKPTGNQVVTSGLTQIETQTEPTAPISAETEEERKGKERKEKGRGNVFVLPTIEEATEYDKEIGFAGVAQWFAYYETNGWKVGKNKMTDWKAAIRYWKSKDGAAFAAPTLDEWMEHGERVATANPTHSRQVWPRALAQAAYHGAAANGWRGVTDWKGKILSECLRWVGNENGRART